MRFKDFVGEAKKKVDDWHLQDREYSSIAQMKTSLGKSIPDHYRQQLFVPKRRDPKVMQTNAARRRVWAAYSDLEKSGQIKEEAPPVLTAFRESPPGSNKPDNGFWTSTAINTKNGWTSDWYKLVMRAFPTWQTDYGYLFKIEGQPLLFDLSYAENFYTWAMDHGRIKKAPSDYAPAYSGTHMRIAFPWDELAKHFDGVYHNGYSSRDSDDISYGWDVESTVWFDTSFLKYAGAVKLVSFGSEDE